MSTPTNAAAPPQQSGATPDQTALQRRDGSAQAAITANIKLGDDGIRFKDLGEMWNFCVIAHRSKLVPAALKTTEEVFIAMQCGLELGFSPMASLRTIAVINGRPSLWGDGMMALVRRSPQCESILEFFEADGRQLGPHEVQGLLAKADDRLTAVCEVKRKGIAEHRRARFSVADAKRSGLWSKQGPWQQYPQRMLAMRARAFALRDLFSDVLMGIPMVEEIADVIEARPAASAGPGGVQVYETFDPTRVAAPTLDDPIGEPGAPPPAVANDATQTAAPIADEGFISEPQRRRLLGICDEHKTLKSQLNFYIFDRYGIESTTKIPAARYEEICAAVAAGEVARVKEG